MLTTLGWFMFGMFVWVCCIFVHRLQERFAPNMSKDWGMDSATLGSQNLSSSLGFGSSDSAKNEEIAELKKRIEILEAIVTDRKYQWEQEYRQQG